MSDLKEKALQLYEAPFSLDHGYIWDAKGEMFADSVNGARIDPVVVAQVRGWGRIQKLDDAENLQDEVGRLIVEALNDKWSGKIKDLEQKNEVLRTACSNAAKTLREFYEDDGINGNQPQVLNLEKLAEKNNS